MSFEQFIWIPRVDPEGTSRFRVHAAQFGGGYAQEVGDGVNNETRSWPLEFVGREQDVSPIRDFFRRHGGFRPFLWKPPMEQVEALFVVREFKLRPVGGGAYLLAATFEERFAP